MRRSSSCSSSPKTAAGCGQHGPVCNGAAAEALGGNQLACRRRCHRSPQPSRPPPASCHRSPSHPLPAPATGGLHILVGPGALLPWPGCSGVQGGPGIWGWAAAVHGRSGAPARVSPRPATDALLPLPLQRCVLDTALLPLPPAAGVTAAPTASPPASPTVCSVIACAAQAAPAECEGAGEAAARAINIPTTLLDALDSHAAQHGRRARRRDAQEEMWTPPQLHWTGHAAARPPPAAAAPCWCS